MNLVNLKLVLNSAVSLGGPPALACFARTGLYTCPASLALLILLALKVLLNATQKVKCLKEVGHLTKPVGHTQSTLVGHLKSVLLKGLSNLR